MATTCIELQDMEEPAEAGGLSEETHLFAKFTSTYMIQDFLNVEQNGGVEEAFPRNVQCEAAMVFSDLSGFSKLCESYVEKFAHMDSAGAAMSQAAEKLNVVVNRCLQPLKNKHPSSACCTTIPLHSSISDALLNRF